MYSKEEAKEVRQQFWTMFGKRYDRKWMLYNTKMKDLHLKFSFEDKRAIVSVDLVHDEDFYRHYYFEKIERFKSIMMDEVSSELIFDQDYNLPEGKVISRIYVFLEGVKIQKKTDWPHIYEFFHIYMDRMEGFFVEYKEFIEE
jgi:hypothetical protein